MTRKRYGRIAPAFLLLFLLIFLNASANAETWSFAAFSDNHNYAEPFRNVLRQIKSGEPSDHRFPHSEFVLGVGDYLPLPDTLRAYSEVIGESLPFFPARGNHERPEDVHLIRSQILPASGSAISFFDRASASYYFDWKNVRIICMDAYASGSKIPDDPQLLAWVEQAIVSAGNLDHVFIAIHWPTFPEDFHENPFWGMVLKHTDKVRAIFAGHTHYHLRRYIPDTYGGVFLVNTGNAGNSNHSDGFNTFVQVSVDKDRVQFRAVQTPEKTNAFKVTDTWTITPPER
ncbi:MAG: metallophosphoesterase [Desulfobacteraceae bacterium]|nr:metallophosphoesterase [Desulfobacteraceae bacterium]